jgi:FMN phosphatase YigB (HAD superfamily)
VNKVFSAAEMARTIRESGPDVVSVDLFDTLIYRWCGIPPRAFRIQYRNIKCLLSAIVNEESWVDTRIRHEDIVVRRAHPHEIRIDDIYDSIAGEIALTPDQLRALREAELNAERSVIRPYEDVIDVLREARKSGVSVVITTDTYLPPEFIRSILNELLDFEFELLCSSETRGPKRTGLAYQELKRKFSSKSIIHFGDNAHSDVEMAGRFGVPSNLVVWPHTAWQKRNQLYIDYLLEIGVKEIPLPVKHAFSSEIRQARDEVAWRWACVLLDELVSIRRYADEIKADEIWFLARDCESMFESLTQERRLFSNLKIKYVTMSRAVAYPIMAVIDPQKYLDWADKQPSDDDVANGRRLIELYRTMTEPGTKQVLIVASGWKGRIQVCLQSAVPQVKVYGYYLSLRDSATTESIAMSRTYLEWDTSVICIDAVEALAGFRDATCVGYEQLGDGTWRAAFQRQDGDVCPEDYCESLRRYLASYIAALDQGAMGAAFDTRRRVLRSILMYPDEITFEAFGRGWSISTNPGGVNGEKLIGEANVRRFNILLGRPVRGNRWPNLAIWTLSRRKSIVAALQKFIVIRETMIKCFERILSSLSRQAL